MKKECCKKCFQGGKGWWLTRGRPEPLVDGSPPAAHSPACASRAAAQTFHQRTKKENATKKNRERRKTENAQGSDKEEQRKTRSHRLEDARVLGGMVEDRRAPGAGLVPYFKEEKKPF